MNRTSIRTRYTIFIALLFATATRVLGQFDLEHVYPGGSYSLAPSYSFANQLFLLELETSGWKYVRIDRVARKVDFYHLDHSFWKTVSFGMTSALNPYAQTQDILYISEHLFDLDDGIEFMYTNLYSNGMDTPACVTQIVDEESAGLIFNVSGQYPSAKPNWHMQQFPIRNTPVGTKLVLSAVLNDSAYVYGLPGELTSGLAENWEDGRVQETMVLYPNPSNTGVTLLLPSWYPGASVDVVASDGQVVVRTMLAQSANVLIDIQALAVGNYVCRFQGADGRPYVASFIKD